MFLAKDGGGGVDQPSTYDSFILVSNEATRTTAGIYLSYFQGSQFSTQDGSDLGYGFCDSDRPT